MGLKIIAAFVETEDIRDSHRKLGVDYTQGYHLGRPVPLRRVLSGHGYFAAHMAGG
jgi:EAL domain-containing protein (putative c-di-GMP-specific phosphodiesterase class I)